MAASVNVFALLESDDPGDSDGAKAKADAAARMRGIFSKKQPPQMSAWKINKVKAEADAAAAASTKTNTNTGGKSGNNRRQPQQQLAAPTKTNTASNNKKPQQPATMPSRAQTMTTAKVNNVGKNSKPQHPVSAAANAAGMNMMPKQATMPSRVPVGAAGNNAAMNMKPKQPAAASAAHVNTATNPHDNVQQFQQQQPVAPARGNLGDQLQAYANSVRTLVYRNRKQNAKGGVAGGAPTDGEKGGQTNGAAVKDAPAPVQEETPAPV